MEDAMKEKFLRFMQGRYGADKLGQFLSGVSVALLVISIFDDTRISFAAALLILIYSYFRIFSRNIPKRYAENQKYLAATMKLRQSFAKKKSEMQQRRIYHIYKCPGCGQKMRIPKGKGKIDVRCPKCNTIFVKKS